MNEQNIPQSNEYVKSSKHIWITIIAVLVTAVIIGGGVYVWQQSSLQSTEESLQQQITDLQNQVKNLQKPTQTPTQPTNETANWKTYQNAELGFSFKHPDLEITFCNELSHGCGLGLAGNSQLFNEILFAKYKLPPSHYPSSFGVLVTENSIQENFDDFVKNEEVTLFKSFAEYHSIVAGGKNPEELRKNLRVEQITVDDTNGYVLEGYTTEEGPWRRYYFPLKSNKVLAITENDNNFNKILATFEFSN